MPPHEQTKRPRRISGALGRRFAQDQRGAVLLISALVLFMLAGFGALALDTAYLYARQNELQTTADAGALAAASQLPDVAETTAVAFEFVTKNMPVASYGDVLVNADVVVGTWDTAARTFEPGGESPDAVRVVTRSADANSNPAAAFFAQVFGHRSVDVSASSVAGIGKPFCLMALAPDGEGIRVESNANITLTGCSIQVNSGDSLALSTYSDASITADSMCVNGGYSGSPGSYSPLPDTGCPVQQDPLADLMPMILLAATSTTLCSMETAPTRFRPASIAVVSWVTATLRSPCCRASTS